MRNVKFWGILVVVLSLVGAIVGALMTGEKSPMLASGSVVLSDDLTVSAEGIRTLFIIVHDAESQMPMPFGAMRERIKENAKGSFFRFYLTKERISAMNPNAELPKVLRLKARLDIDGNGGMDQAGDLTGTVDGVPFGAEDVLITIDKKVE